MPLLTDTLAVLTGAPVPSFVRRMDKAAPLMLTVAATTRRASSGSSARGSKVARGRASQDEPETMFQGALAVYAPIAPAHFWREHNLDRETLNQLTVEQIIDLMLDVSPEISRAVWDSLRMVNPGSELKVYQLEPEQTTPAPTKKKGKDKADAEADDAPRATGDQQPQQPVEDPAGTRLLNDYLGLLAELYGAADVVFNKIIMGGIVGGGFLAEAVLGADGRTPIDMATPDPRTLKWRKVKDPLRGAVWQYGQTRDGQFHDLSQYLTVGYVPIDPAPGKPYGRSLLHPALFPTLFLLMLLHDLKRVVAQQGYPRMDVAVKLEALAASLGGLEDAAGNIDPVRFKAEVEKIMDEVASSYEVLEPDDIWIHTDVTEIKGAVGTVDAKSLGAIDGLIGVLERMMVRALKSMPLLMSIGQNSSESTANREWEVHAAGIQSLQHLVENLIQSLMTVIARANGLAVKVEFRFAVLRASERMRDAQAEALEIKNEESKYKAGWTSHMEASMKITGHPPDDPDGPRAAAAAPAPGNLLTAQPEPGANRGQLAKRILMSLGYQGRSVETAVLMLEPEQPPSAAAVERAVSWWEQNADDDLADLINADPVVIESE